jgi:hypothetical protein
VNGKTAEAAALAARRPPRFEMPSTVRERNAAICNRLTVPVGS